MAGGGEVIVVGSGPAGISAAWPLVEAGIGVLMMDASDGMQLPLPPAQDSLEHWKQDPERWRHELGLDGSIETTARSPKFATPLSRATLAGFASATGVETDNYFAVGSLAAGGLSRIWGALVAEWSPDELEPWGEQRDEMAAAYARVRARIGTSAPPLLSPAIERIRYSRQSSHASDVFTLELADNAVLDRPREGREACNACGLCLMGCGRESIYHGAQELDALKRRANFTYWSGALVTRLSRSGTDHRVHIRSAGGMMHVDAPAVLLAAGTLTTTKLVLGRLGLQNHPLRLESNPVGGTAFLIPGLVGSPPPRRSFGLGQLFYTLRPRPGVEMAGIFYGADTLPLSTIADRLPFTRPAALRFARALMPALALATGYLPGRFSENSVTLEDDGAEGCLVVRGHSRTDADALLRDGFKILGREVRRLGGWQMPLATQLLGPGSDAHPGATLPMGGAGPAATDYQGEVAGLPGLYVVDGSGLPALSARHPTLTIMANADRIGRALARSMAFKSSVAAHAL